MSLLATLVDSNLVKAADYNDYYTRIYFEAKVELKRHQIKDEALMEKEMKELLKDEEEERVLFIGNVGDKSNISTYSILLLPFYEKHKTVPLFFNACCNRGMPW